MTVPAFVRTTNKALVRDTKTRALLNTDRAARDRTRAVRAKSRTTAQRLDALEAEILELKRIIHGI